MQIAIKLFNVALKTNHFEILDPQLLNYEQHHNFSLRKFKGKINDHNLTKELNKTTVPLKKHVISFSFPDGSNIWHDSAPELFYLSFFP